jgi:hypothetical protein
MGHNTALLAVAGVGGGVYPPTEGMIFGYLYHGNVNDLTGNHPSTNNGATFVADRKGIANQALDFALGDNVSADADWADPNVLSLFTWVKPTGTPSDDRLISWRETAAKYLVFRFVSGRVQVLWGNGSTAELHTTDDVVITGGAFQSAGFSLDGANTPAIYYNGLPKATSQTGNPTSRNLGTGPFTIGADASGNKFTGINDDALAWGVIKTPAQFLALHNDSKP